jgi:hypothetical protein
MSKKKRKNKRMPDFIEGNTGHSSKYWIEYIQRSIARHTSKARTRGPLKSHGTTSLVWVDKLRKHLLKSIRKTRKGGKPYDSNMNIAFNLGFILLQWYFSIHRAKVMDPRRKLVDRKAALGQLWQNRLAVATLIVDEIPDQNLYKQEWDYPLDTNVEEGDFA